MMDDEVLVLPSKRKVKNVPQQIEKVPLSECSEEQIAELIIAWLEEQYWDVYQEVSLWSSGAVDIVAKKENIVWAIEVKKRLNFEVIYQAYRNIRCFHFSSVATPAPSKNRYSTGREMAKQICQDYGIGVIELEPNVAFDGRTIIHRYDDEIYVNEYVAPKLFRKNYKFIKEHLLPNLMPEHKTYAKAGSKGGLRFTPYKVTIEHVKRILQLEPGLTLKKLITELGIRHHYSSQASVMGGLRVALRDYENKWCAIVGDKKPYRYYHKESKKYEEYIKRAETTG